MSIFASSWLALQKVNAAGEDVAAKEKLCICWQDGAIATEAIDGEPTGFATPPGSWCLIGLGGAYGFAHCQACAVATWLRPR